MGTTGDLVDGARVLQLFGDAVTEVLIGNDGDEGLMRALDAEFFVPVWSGDYLEIRAKLTRTGNTSRTFECTAHKVVELVQPSGSSARVLTEPLLVAKALAIAVVPLDRQRPKL